MSEERAAAPDAPAPGAAGFVEALGPERALGWAWHPGDPARRAAVVLRGGGETLAEAVADQAREDLARHGVGDGAHAFALEIPPGWRARLAELEVAVRLPEGGLVPLAPAPAEAPAEWARLQRGLAQVAAAQRAMLRAVRGPAEGQQANAELLARIAATQDRLERDVAALEIFVNRLDDRLAALAAEAPPARAARGPLLLAGLLGAAALAALAAAVVPLL